MANNYILLTHIHNGTGSPGTLYYTYSNLNIPGLIVPEYIPGPDMSDKPNGTRILVEVDDKCTSVISIVEIFDRNVWLKNKIVDINAFNKTLMSSAAVKKIDIPIPDEVIIDPVIWQFIIATIMLGKYPLFTGPTGCGKTQLAESIAKALGYQFYPINCGSIFKPKSTLVGTVKASEGSTFLVDSEFLTYFQSDKPTIIFLDEISRIPSAAANMMMTITDRKQSYVYVEELAKRIFKGKNVIFIAAANFGIQYVDTRKLDSALKNRFIPFHLKYLPESEEIKLIMSRIQGINAGDVKKLVNIANLLRANYDTLAEEVSHRNMLDYCEYLTLNFTYPEIVNNLMINLFVNGNDDRRDEVEQLLNGKLP